jgi:membrane fusion protein (multidrug efflux system)
MRKQTIVWTMLGCVCLASCQNEKTEEKPQVYPVLTVGVSSIKTTDYYPASIQGQQDIEIYPQVSGKIMEVSVTEGERVRRGQTLFIIDQIPYKAALETAVANVKAAKANVSTAQLTYNGKKELFAEKVISQFELSTAENALLTAKAQQAQAEAQEVDAKNNLSYTVVTSPTDGVVGTIPYRIGTLVSSSSSQPLTTVSDNSVMYVYFSMPENRLLSLVRRYGSVEETLKHMQPVNLQLNDGSIYDQLGRIESISGVLDKQTGAASFRAAFPNPTGLLHSGGAGNVLITENLDNALTIPQVATYELQDKVFVYRIIHGKTKSIPIEVTPLNDKKLYIVRKGLNVGDTIVAEGVGLLKDGIPIVIKQ